MSKRISLIIIMLMIVFLTGCDKSIETGAVAEQAVNTYDGITMEIMDGTVSATGMTIEIINQTDIEVNSGNENDFAIQVKRDGTWYEIPTKERNNTGEAIIFLKDAPVQMEISWRSIYGFLPKGNYRIVKGFFPWTEEKGSGTTFALAAEFCIE